MVKWRVKNLPEFLSTFLDGAHSLGEAVFAETQDRVPVASGDLKKSGRLIKTQTGFIIEYTAPYASRVHDGVAAGEIEPVKSSKVRTHSRKMKTKTVTVTEHDREAHTRVYPDGIEGQPYITDAFKAKESEIPKYMVLRRSR